MDRLKIEEKKIKGKLKDCNFLVYSFVKPKSKKAMCREMADDHYIRSRATIMGNMLDEYAKDLLEQRKGVKHLIRQAGEGLDVIYVDEDYQSFNNIFMDATRPKDYRFFTFGRPIEVHAQMKSSSKWGNSTQQSKQKQTWAEQRLYNEGCELLNAFFFSGGKKSPRWGNNKVLTIEGGLLWRYLSGIDNFSVVVHQVMQEEAESLSFYTNIEKGVAELAERFEAALP